MKKVKIKIENMLKKYFQPQIKCLKTMFCEKRRAIPTLTKITSYMMSEFFQKKTIKCLIITKIYHTFSFLKILMKKMEAQEEDNYLFLRNNSIHLLAYKKEMLGKEKPV